MGHFYDKDGKPKHFYINKKGVSKPSTLREARKNNWVPGVTTIISEGNRPQLTDWIAEQLLKTSLEFPQLAIEAIEDYIDRIKGIASERQDLVMYKGNEIHDAIERGFLGKTLQPDELKYYLSVLETITKECGEQDWIPEKSFATDKYGGTVDLHCPNPCLILDFKTTEKDISKLSLYDNHFMQLAAYWKGLDLWDAGCGVVYINSLTAESRILWMEDLKLGRGLDMFTCLLNYYYCRTEL